METQPLFRGKMVSVLAGAVIFLGLYAARLYNYLLFHTSAELFTIVVASSVFIVTWNARNFEENRSFLFLGIGSLFAGGISFLHALAYKGMGVFPGQDANLPTQLWISARAVFAATLFLAPRFAGRKLDHRFVLAA